VFLNELHERLRIERWWYRCKRRLSSAAHSMRQPLMEIGMRRNAEAKPVGVCRRQILNPL
jgi:hypothetical protein